MTDTIDTLLGDLRNGYVGAQRTEAIMQRAADTIERLRSGGVASNAADVVRSIWSKNAPPFHQRNPLAEKIVAEILEELSAAPPPPVSGAGEDHEWFSFRNMTCCRKCGIVQRADGKNKPCKGVVSVGLREVEQPSGWIVGNGDGTKFRCWEPTGPNWTSDKEKALRFARHEDAEAFAAEDEDAWSILPVSASATPPESINAEMLEALRREAFNSGVMAAAKVIADRRDAYVEDHGFFDPTTGATEFPGNGEETVGEWDECEEEILSLIAKATAGKESQDA